MIYNFIKTGLQTPMSPPRWGEGGAADTPHITCRGLIPADLELQILCIILF